MNLKMAIVEWVSGVSKLECGYRLGLYSVVPRNEVTFFITGLSLVN